MAGHLHLFLWDHFQCDFRRGISGDPKIDLITLGHGIENIGTNMDWCSVHFNDRVFAGLHDGSGNNVTYRT